MNLRMQMVVINIIPIRIILIMIALSLTRELIGYEKERLFIQNIRLQLNFL